MSKIKNGGLDQYGKVQSLNRIGDEGVNSPDQLSTVGLNQEHVHIVICRFLRVTAQLTPMPVAK